MKLCTFVPPSGKRGARKVGVVEDNRIFEVAGVDDMVALMTSSRRGKALKKGSGRRLDLARLLAPVPRPGKIVAAIVNTQGMLGGADVKLDRPRLDMKAPSAVVGPGSAILAPEPGIRPEVELAAVIGKTITRATPAQAVTAIFGYTILNDVTAPRESREDAYEAYRRDTLSDKIVKRVMRGPLFRSKSHDTFCPMGPWLVTADELSDTSDLRMTTRFGDMLVQDGTTSEYIFSSQEIAAYVSGFLTLEPGDVISCGSVGWTADAIGGLDPSEFILSSRRGTLELRIDNIGELRNPVRPAPGHPVAETAERKLK